jgi:glucans biosynthesis protein
MTVLSRFARLCCAIFCAHLPHAAAFTFDDVAERARLLSETPYKAAQSNLPREVRALTYDEYRDIRYKPERNHWRAAKLPFELAFFHQGLYYEQPVKIHEVAANGSVREIRFDPADFDYGKNTIDPARMRGLGFAGFRVHHAVNTADYKDEVTVFLGASYFRALRTGDRYCTAFG